MMDDAWSSPWASEAQRSPGFSRAKTTTKDNLELPPRAFLCSTSSSPREPLPNPLHPPSASPWADDGDRSDDWAYRDGTNNNTNTQAIWGGNSGPSSLLPTPQTGTFGYLGATSPIAWPGTVAMSKTNSGFALRWPSQTLDPWASESPPFRSNDGSPTLRLVHEQDVQFQTPSRAPREDVQVPASRPSPTDGTKTRDFEQEHAQEELSPGLHHHEAEHEVENESTSEESRPPSLSEHESDVDIERQGSPMTSIDDESKARQQRPRRGTGVVQEMVVKFDGLAKASVQEPPAPSRRSRASTFSRSRSGQRAEFEDGESDENKEVDTAGKEVFVPMPVVDGIDFHVDLSYVDQLFDKQKLPPSDGALDPNPHVPDHIITDTFGETNERRAWYRISRQGSSRRHDAGDDDSYRRVAWEGSAVRRETAIIVKRWLEENTNGLPVPGGGPGRGHGFGWNSAAEPVSLSQVYGRRSDHASVQPLEPAPRTPPKLPGPVASFSWSSPPVEGLAEAERADQTVSGAAVAIPVHADKALGFDSCTKPTPLAKSGSGAVALPGPIPEPAPGAIAVVMTPFDVADGDDDDDDDSDDEDDDEWGDMVFGTVDAGLGDYTLDVLGVSTAHANMDLTTTSAVMWHLGDGSSPPIVAQQVETTHDALPRSILSVATAPANSLAPALHAHKSSQATTQDFTPTTPLEIASPTALSERSVTPPSPPMEESQGFLARLIVSRLPDLSYMLR